MMNNKNILLRQKVFEYVDKEYNSKIEYLWMRYPSYAVFRNNESKKWYGIVMDISYKKLGIDKDGIVDILNVKVNDFLLKDFLIDQKGIFNGYHIAKGNWISILLDGTVEINKIFELIDESYNIVSKKRSVKK